MPLTTEAVHDLYTDKETGILFRPEEPTGDAVIVQGITRTFGFHPSRLNAAKPTIAHLLTELPDSFQENSGAGWSFLNGCLTKDEHQWGEQRDVEELFCAAIAAGLARWVMPREMWDVLPGGMPYFVINAHPALPLEVRP
jgi:hypothetical protein